MKLNASQSNVQSGGMNLEVHYKIEANRKSFDVLSGDMYSYIIPTIVRELSSNAFDSHLEAEKRGEVGQGSVPFTVGCPSAFDPYLTVSDEGIGLRYYNFNAKIRNDASEDVEGDITSTVFIKGDIRKDVAGIDTVILTQNGNSQTLFVPSYLYDKSTDETCFRLAGEFNGDNVTIEFDDTLVLYSTYFKSTKEETNDYIGGYGLGAKTPLAYTDNFMVTNRFNGTERVYSIYKNAEGMPCINLMGTVDTDLHNGMEIKVGVASDDYNEFKEAIEDQLKFFTPQPLILNDIVEMPQVLYTGENFLLMDTENRNGGYGYYRKSSASVGFNAYNIQHVQSSLFGEKLVLRFAIGEVKVTASREELKYDDNTIAMIQKREEDAIEEYRNYIMDTIDADGLEDYEKAIFLNSNHDVLDLRDDKIKSLVGNSHYKYTEREITIPITGWGDYTELTYTDDTEYDRDDEGNVVYVDGKPITMVTGNSLKPNLSRTRRALSWYGYSTRNGKTTKMGADQWVRPDNELLVFIRDNSFSFLKKIGYYLDENDVDTYEKTILILDMFSDKAASTESLNMVKSLVSHTATFVRLSDISLPKNISLTPSRGYTTPTARLFDPSNHNFSNPKHWSEVYTPLTKIDTDAYVIQTHRGAFEDISWNDQQFMTQYLKSELEWNDDEITILVLSRARYEKAIKYGFKPASELVAELKKKVTIPIDVVHSNLVSDLEYNIRQVDIIGLLRGSIDVDLDKIDRDTNLGRLLRVGKVIRKRYTDRSDKFDGLNSLMEYMDEDSKPEASETVTEMVDKFDKMCDTMYNEFPLVEDQRSYNFQTEEKVAALIEYINFIQAKSKAQEQDDNE